MHEVKFVKLITCKECKKEINNKTLKEKQLILRERWNISRCFGCENLIDIADELKGVRKYDNKKNKYR